MSNKHRIEYIYKVIFCTLKTRCLEELSSVSQSTESTKIQVDEVSEISDQLLLESPESPPPDDLEEINFAEKDSELSIQKISRQMRFTFFKESVKCEDKLNYEANLPVLPPNVNLNASSTNTDSETSTINDKIVNPPKTQLPKKRYSSKSITIIGNVPKVGQYLMTDYL